VKDLYSEPFISSWPTPLSFRDIKECFRIAKPFGGEVRVKLNSERKIYIKKGDDDTNIIKAFWNVFFSPLGFNA